MLNLGFLLSVVYYNLTLKPFWSVRESLHIADQDVLMYGIRVIIPSSLQRAVLKILHSAHQGVPSMCSRDSISISQ